MSDIYDRIALAAGEVKESVTTAGTVAELNTALDEAAIVVPDRTFAYLQHAMAQFAGDWPDGTSFQPLTGKMNIAGVAIKPFSEG